MRSSTFLTLICLQLACLTAFGRLLPGGSTDQSTKITPELEELINDGLEQLNRQGGDFAIGDMKKVVVMKYSTQVVAGTLSNLLLEVRLKQGSKLVSMKLLDQAWTNTVHKLTQGCVYTKKSGNFYPAKCDSVSACQDLLTQKGTCWSN
mmetsp:Transcript_56782/g.65056  ORF Transcript_56782/g.65056 Transcript_56782/m.65056 type:complete len:149 (+) Transcript_56782:42-488(+)